MSRSPDNEDGCFVAMDTEEDGTDPAGINEEVDTKMGSWRQDGAIDSCAKGAGRTMMELPEEVLEYILSFLSPYQEHKTAALVCKQWYRLIKGRAHVFSMFTMKQEWRFLYLNLFIEIFFLLPLSLLDYSVAPLLTVIPIARNEWKYK